ncbi:MAG: restriction endonuclease subunit S, partial [Ruminococcus sp.]|nr:restriction endonuclease subunit S [Ruminococcus sp.]
GTMVKKVSMDMIQPFCRDISAFEMKEFSGGTKFRNGDTLMARITPCLENGKTVKVNILYNNEIGFGSTEYIVFRAIDGITDADFIYYLICSPIVRKPAIKSMVGSSGRQRVQTDVLKNLEIRLPDLKTQCKIGSLLKSLDDKIELNNRINKNLEEQEQAIFKNFFSKFKQNGILSDIADITMGQSPKGTSYNMTGAGIVFFQGRTDFGYRFPTVRMYTTEPKKMAETGDILMSVRAPVGDLNIAHQKCCIGRGLASIRSKNNHNSFLFYTLSNIKEQLDIFNGQGTVFGAINRKSLKELIISVPPCELIEKFEMIVSPLDKVIRNNYNENQRLSALRDALLPELMSGKIKIP